MSRRRCSCDVPFAGGPGVDRHRSKRSLRRSQRVPPPPRPVAGAVDGSCGHFARRRSPGRASGTRVPTSRNTSPFSTYRPQGKGGCPSETLRRTTARARRGRRRAGARRHARLCAARAGLRPDQGTRDPGAAARRHSLRSSSPQPATRSRPGSSRTTRRAGTTGAASRTHPTSRSTRTA